MESRKMVLKNLFTGQQWRNRHREQTYGHVERGGEGELYEKSNMETYITICRIDTRNKTLTIWNTADYKHVDPRQARTRG